MIDATFFAVAVLAVVHAASARLRFLRVIPRSRWLSAAGGVAVAYVFMHLLPAVARRGDSLRLPGVDHTGFVIALAGIVAFYGLTRAAQRPEGERSDRAVFWLHIAAFSLYNAVIGYLVRAEERDSLVMFTIAMALHFVVVDYGLEEDHREPYRRFGRWILVAALLAGWGISLIATVPAHVVDVVVAFLAGGIVLNVMKEELPRERESRFGAFLLGVAAYALILAVA